MTAFFESGFLTKQLCFKNSFDQATWSLFDTWAAFLWVKLAGFALSTFFGTLDTRLNHFSLDLSIRRRIGSTFMVLRITQMPTRVVAPSALRKNLISASSF